jgi:hypothetical protein
MYVALLKSKIPVLLLLLALLIGSFTAIVTSQGWFSGLLAGHVVPIINPYNPLPDTDPNVLALEDDGSAVTADTSGESEGGSVSLVYSLDASLDLGTGQIGIYFQNPSNSNHAAAIQLYITSEGTDTLIAKSGLIPAGTGLYQLDMIKDSAVLSEGLYEGKYRVIFYNPVTGERALVESEITDLVITAAEK